jgi:hypothetical protein
MLSHHEGLKHPPTLINYFLKFVKNSEKMLACQGKTSKETISFII